MAEQMIDFDEWLATYQPPEIKYFALFDKDTGRVMSVGPSHAFENESNKLEIDKEIAEQILEGKIWLEKCFVDINAQTLEISEVRQVYKIDDVLHRIIAKEYTEIEKPDLYITCDRKNKTVKFQMTEEYNGTYKQDEKFQPIKKRKILWDGDTDLNFLITDYNDPNVLYKMITIKLNDLVEQEKIIEDVELPIKFSVYTRRVFKNYVIEYK